MTPVRPFAAGKSPAAGFFQVLARPFSALLLPRALLLQRGVMVAIFAFFLALALALPAAAAGLFDGGKPKAADWDKARDGQRVELEGTVRLIGNEPFTEVVITDAEGRDWFLDAEGEHLVSLKEHRPVKVTGTVALKPMTLANGKKLPDRRTLVGLALSE